MSDKRLSQALDRSLKAVMAGASIEDCLQQYPNLRQELRPLLEAALRLQPVSIEMAEEAKEYYRRRMMADIRASRSSRPARRAAFSWPRLLLVPTLAAALVAALVISLTTTQAPDGAEAATLLTVLQGQVLVENAAGTVTAQNGMQLRPGDRILTEGNGRAVLTFVDGSTVTLDGNTEIAIRSVSDQQGKLHVRLSQAKGQTWTHAPGDLSAADIEIETPSGRLLAANASFMTTVDASGRTMIGAHSGALQLQTGNQRSAVQVGQRVVIDSPGVITTTTVDDAAKELVIRVSGAFHVYVTDPSGSTVGTLAPGVPVSQVTGATAKREGNGVVIRIPDARPGSYRIVLRSTGAGGVEVFASLADVGRDSIAMRVSPDEDWGVLLVLQQDLIGFAQADKLTNPDQPNVAIAGRAAERAVATADALTPSPVATGSPAVRTPTVTQTPTPVVTRTPTDTTEPARTPTLEPEPTR